MDFNVEKEIDVIGEVLKDSQSFVFAFGKENALKIDKIKPKRVKIDEVQTKSKDKGQGTSCPLKKTLTMSFRGEMSERICSRER